MSGRIEAVWINASPSLQGFDRPLLKQLSEQIGIVQWQYDQTPDEPTCLDTAVDLLHDYCQQQPHSLHLLGHGTGGLLGLLYARRYPHRVRSLTLLSVGVHPAIDWQAHYYLHLQLLPCNRETVLRQMVYYLFGYQSQPVRQNLLRTLEADLSTSLSPQTLFSRVQVPSGQAWVPLLACSGQNDLIVDPIQLNSWESFLEPGDRLWQCPGGRYFFHYVYPQDTSQQILNFWASLTQPSPLDSTAVNPYQPLYC